MTTRILVGDCRTTLATLPSGSVHTCVTSPPYFGLRDYGHAGQIGLEPTPAEYVAELVAVFREVRRVLRDDGTLWINLGDSYAGSTMTGGNAGINASGGEYGFKQQRQFSRKNETPGVKPKDLIGIPWRVAFALQADGWYLRQDIIWAKPNPMPESVRDRCTKSHEYIFLLSKSERYYYDAEAIAEPVSQEDRPQRARAMELAREAGLTAEHLDAIAAAGVSDVGKALVTTNGAGHNTERVMALAAEAKAALGGYYREFLTADSGKRNKRSVWTVTTQPFKDAHFATFPPALIEPCILAGAPAAGKRCDCDEVIETPLGRGVVDDPSLATGRAGMNRPRRDDEGTRPITRRQQRHNATEIKESPYRAAMEGEAGTAFQHYIRTDRAGARPIPPSLFDVWLSRGWVTVAPPCDCQDGPAGIVLDPFGGAGTTGLVADRLGRDAILCELNPAYAKMAEERLRADAGMFAKIEVARAD